MDIESCRYLENRQKNGISRFFLFYFLLLPGRGRGEDTFKVPQQGPRSDPPHGREWKRCGAALHRASCRDGHFLDKDIAGAPRSRRFGDLALSHFRTDSTVFQQEVTGA
jgi:hypothetical protein